MCNDLIGIPFHDGGRAREGCDCWGLYRLAVEAMGGGELPDFGMDYVDTDDRQGIAQIINRETASIDWLPVDQGNEQPGDCVVFKMYGLPNHVGCVIRPGVMLHIERKVNSVVESYDSMIWRKRLVGFYRPSSLIEKVSEI